MPDLPRLLISIDRPPADSRRPSCRPCRRPLVLAPTPLRPAGCSGGPWAQLGVTYQRPAGTLRRHVTGNGAWETLREEEGEGFRADSPTRALLCSLRPRGRWESQLLGLEGGGSLRPAAQRHRSWGPRQTLCACVLLPPNSALRWGCGRDSTAACKAGSASSCSRARYVRVQLGLLAAQGPGEDRASCFSLRGALSWPCLGLVRRAGCRQLGWAVRLGPWTLPPHTMP